jgi:hypothetical protein
MRYYLDTEFNEFGGDLISLALVRDDGESLYLVYPDLEEYGPWVKENVVPILWSIPSPLTGMSYKLEDHKEGAYHIQEFLHGDPHPVILTDWPDDIRYFCQAIITGPGMMINTGPSIVFQMVRVDAYPTTLEDAVQHNAWWDAMALRQLLK